MMYCGIYGMIIDTHTKMFTSSKVVMGSMIGVGYEAMLGGH